MSTKMKPMGAPIASAYLVPNELSVHSDAKMFTSSENTENELSTDSDCLGHGSGATASTATIWNACTTIEIDAGNMRLRTIDTGVVPSDLGGDLSDTKTTMKNATNDAPTTNVTNAAKAPTDAGGHLLHCPLASAKYPGWQSLQR
eukprot:Amastigsp_a345851_13.p4 type:complete len:145 gc:universal Amastigsp_a345851_13:440-874(+)